MTRKTVNHRLKEEVQEHLRELGQAFFSFEELREWARIMRSWTSSDEFGPVLTELVREGVLAIYTRGGTTIPVVFGRPNLSDG